MVHQLNFLQLCRIRQQNVTSFNFDRATFCLIHFLSPRSIAVMVTICGVKDSTKTNTLNFIFSATSTLEN